jgi:hypothetical protein
LEVATGQACITSRVQLRKAPNCVKLWDHDANYIFGTYTWGVTPTKWGVHPTIIKKVTELARISNEKELVEAEDDLAGWVVNGERRRRN